jgi:hypothetical protein
MQPSSSWDLLKILQDVGRINFIDLIFRQTGPIGRLFDSLKELKDEEMIDIKGDVQSIENFINNAKKLEQEGLEEFEFKDKLFKKIKEQPDDVREAIVSLSDKGFLRLRRY